MLALYLVRRFTFVLLYETTPGLDATIYRVPPGDRHGRAEVVQAVAEVAAAYAASAAQLRSNEDCVAGHGKSRLQAAQGRIVMHKQV
jgi:hypothetical protein